MYASSAGAATIEIDFDFSQSSIEVLGGVVSIPPDGAISAASARLLVEGDGLMTPTPSGMVEFESFGLSASISATVLGELSVWGVVTASQAGPFAGTLTSGLAAASFPNDLILNLNAAVDCTPLPVVCAVAGFPLEITDEIQTLSPIGPLAIGNLETIGSATIMATLPITFSGVSAVLTLVGNEVSRQLPEPGGYAGAATALLVLAAVRLASRARQKP